MLLDMKNHNHGSHILMQYVTNLMSNFNSSDEKLVYG